MRNLVKSVKNIINKLMKWKKILITVLILIVLLWMIFDYVKRHGGEAMFDMQKINGVADNNPYGIRNDVYDFVVSDMRKSGIKELENPAVKNLLLNFVKVQLVTIKMFSDREKSIEIGYQEIMIMGCIDRYRYINNNHDIDGYFSGWITDPETYSHDTDYSKVLYKTKDHELIRDITSEYFNGKTLQPNGREIATHKYLCDRYESRVLNEEEFWVKDPRIKGK